MHAQPAPWLNSVSRLVISPPLGRWLGLGHPTARWGRHPGSGGSVCRWLSFHLALYSGLVVQSAGATTMATGPMALSLPPGARWAIEVAGTTVLPAAMALAVVVGATFTATRLDLLIDWSERHAGRGEHVVTSCGPVDARGGDRWSCEGALVVDGSSVDVRSDLVASRNATSSHQPYVGQRTEVFFDLDELGTVHPTAQRLNELARLYLSLLPRILLTGGAAMWLAGWALTRGVDSADLLVQDRIRFPGRFAWQRRGLTWIVVAAGALVANHLLTTRVIGSLGTF